MPCQVGQARAAIYRPCMAEMSIFNIKSVLPSRHQYPSYTINDNLIV